MTRMKTCILILVTLTGRAHKSASVTPSNAKLGGGFKLSESGSVFLLGSLSRLCRHFGRLGWLIRSHRRIFGLTVHHKTSGGEFD